MDKLAAEKAGEHAILPLVAQQEARQFCVEYVEAVIHVST